MHDNTDSDEFLMQASGQGDLEAFARLVDRHQVWGWRVAYRFTGDHGEAADIVQDAFLRLLAASSRYRPTAQFRTYFYRIISRLCLDRRRKRRLVLLPAIPETADPSVQVSDTMIRGESAQSIRAALESLPSSQRMAIVLRYYEDMSYEEIASAMDTTTKAVERLLARGRKRLRGLLGSSEHFSQS
ncbi:MAG: RNA polymerase sigma factor [Verrucomicrobiota bacterium]|nr:RNA polymerase sigma factor [Verrucomicrobiota bacterium]